MTWGLHFTTSACIFTLRKVAFYLKESHFHEGHERQQQQDKVASYRQLGPGEVGDVMRGHTKANAIPERENASRWVFAKRPWQFIFMSVKWHRNIDCFICFPSQGGCPLLFNSLRLPPPGVDTFQTPKPTLCCSGVKQSSLLEVCTKAECTRELPGIPEQGS